MEDIGTYNFIDVGSIGRRGLAELLGRQGRRVRGSDLAEGAITRPLQTLKVNVYKGHRAELVEEATIVVHFTAVK